MSVATALALAQVAPAGAQPPPQIRAVRLAAPVVVDGDLSDAVWQAGAGGTGFTQREPHEGEPATEPTEFWVAYTPNMLYVAVRAEDATPRAIVAREMERDAPLYRDDSVVVVLDTFGDRRNGYAFETNPNGARFDALITDEGREVTPEWDGVWTVGARRTSYGWAAEFAIPFATLRFDPHLDTWGLNVRRMIRHKDEEVNWAPLSRGDADVADQKGYAVYRVSLAGRLEGMSDLSRSRALDVKPFTVATLSETVEAAGKRTEEDVEVGLDVKWGVTRNLSMDLTINTDFAEVEADDQQVNLTRFSLFFEEKREFFLENAGIFEFGPPQRDSRSPILMKGFFSRRIGLDQGRVVPIDYGLRLTGRAGGWNLGVLGVQAAETDFGDGGAPVPETGFAVLRLKRNLGRRSGVGIIYTDRDERSTARNQMVGVDFDYKPTRTMDLAGFWSQVDDDRLQGDDWAAGYSYGFRDSTLEASLEHLRVNEGYRPEIGFLLRQNFERFRPHVRWRPRVNRWGLRTWFFEGDYDYFERASTGELESRKISVSAIGLRTMGEDGFGLNYDWNTERLFAPFEIREGIVIPPGLYSFDNWRLGGSSNESRRVALQARLTSGDFFGGTRDFANLVLRIRASRHFRWETSLDYNDVVLPQGAFITRIVGQRLSFSFTPDLRLNALLQYDDSAQLVAANVRFNWIYRPGADLFVVYNETWDAPTFDARQTQGRELIVKFTYLFQP